MSHPGMRWTASSALSPANFLQLQQTVGNQAIVSLLKRSPDAPAVFWAARKDGITPPTGADSEQLMIQHPRYGDWQFRFIADGRTGATLMYWITLNRYKNRQRHLLIEAETGQPHEFLGADLDSEERKALSEWAVQLLQEMLSGRMSSPPPAATGGADAAAGGSEEEEMLNGWSGADDGDGDSTPFPR